MTARAAGAKHTEGPWTARQMPHRIYRSEVMSGKIVIAHALTEANARLIAESPAMLAALRAALHALTNMTTDEFRRGDDNLVREKIRAILARIDGASDAAP